MYNGCSWRRAPLQRVTVFEATIAIRRSSTSGNVRPSFRLSLSNEHLACPTNEIKLTSSYHFNS